MRRAYAVLLLAGAGCAHVEYSPPRLEDNVAAVASLKAEPVVRPLDSVEKPIPDPDKPIDLAVLWDLTLTNNPRLRESSADVEAARGRLIQAGLYPNPRLVYRGDEVGLRDAPKGNQSVELLQEIVTAKKLQLDQAAAGRGVDAAGVALLGRKFEVLSRVRRLYYGYISLEYTLKAYDEVVAASSRASRQRASSWKARKPDPAPTCCACRHYWKKPVPRRHVCRRICTRPGSSWQPRLDSADWPNLSGSTRSRTFRIGPRS